MNEREIHRQCWMFGFARKWMPDIDGDDFPDLIVGTLTDTMGSSSDEELGVVEVLSGATGSPIHEIRAEEPSIYDKFGWSLCCAGDTDGDGIPDFAMGDPGTFFSGRGLVQVRSGRDGREIARIAGEEYGHNLGSALCSIEDLDGDGFRELLIGGAAPNVETTSQGYFCVWSPAKNRILFEQEGISSLLE